jgi:hypothetical protein
VYLIAFSASLSLLVKRTAQYRGPPNIDGHTLILNRLSHVYPSLKAPLEWDNGHGLYILLFAVAVATALQLPRRQPLGSVVCVVLAVLTSTTNGGNYHYLWLVPFAIVARQRLLIALLLAFGASRSMIVAFAGGGIYFGYFQYPRLLTVARHAWMLGFVEWAVLLAWFCRDLVEALPRRMSDLLAGYRRVLFLKS